VQFQIRVCRIGFEFELELGPQSNRLYHSAAVQTFVLGLVTAVYNVFFLFPLLQCILLLFLLNEHDDDDDGIFCCIFFLSICLKIQESYDVHCKRGNTQLRTLQ